MRGTWNSAASGEMSGSRPLAEVVTRSIGTGILGFSGFSLGVLLDPLDQRLVGRAQVRAPWNSPHCRAAPPFSSDRPGRAGAPTGGHGSSGRW